MHRHLKNRYMVLRWERLGDIVVLPVTSFKDQAWNSMGEELWPIVANSIGAQRLARQVSDLTLIQRLSVHRNVIKCFF